MLTAKTKLHTKNKRRDHRKEHVAGVWGSPHRRLQTSCGRRQGRRAADQLCGLSGTHGYSKFRTQCLQRSCFLPQSEKKNKRNHTWAPGDLSPSHSAFRNPHHGLSRTCALALAVGWSLCRLAQGCQHPLVSRAAISLRPSSSSGFLCSTAVAVRALPTAVFGQSP